MNELEGFEVLMTDVYKSRTKDLARKCIDNGQDVLIETVFNDLSFKDLVDYAKCWLSNISCSPLSRYYTAVHYQGYPARNTTKWYNYIWSNIRINFNESFKNIANLFFYFDRSDFVYTGEVNKLIMSFQNGELLKYNSNALIYPQNFAQYGFSNGRLDTKAYNIIIENKNFDSSSTDQSEVKFTI